MTVTETLQHAKVRFECLAEEFDKVGDTASWAMCSVDAEMMQRALTAALSDMVVVPAEPTAEMLDAGTKASIELYEKLVKAAHPYEPVFLHADVARMLVEYRAMIAAAPPPVLGGE